MDATGRVQFVRVRRLALYCLQRFLSLQSNTMDGTAKMAYECQSKTLRSELKAWENEWAARHNGAKPQHSDIKQNPAIGARALLLQHGPLRASPVTDARVGPQPRNTRSTTRSAISWPARSPRRPRAATTTPRPPAPGPAASARPQPTQPTPSPTARLPSVPGPRLTLPPPPPRPAKRTAPPPCATTPSPRR